MSNEELKVDPRKLDSIPNGTVLVNLGDAGWAIGEKSGMGMFGVVTPDLYFEDGAVWDKPHKGEPAGLGDNLRYATPEEIEKFIEFKNQNK